MDIRRLLLFTVLPIIIGVALVAGVMLFLTTRSEMSEPHPMLAPTYQQYSAAAQVYINRIGSYDGLCDSLVVADAATCVSDEEQYVVYEFISRQAGYYCTDSSGFRGPVATVSTHIRCEL